MAILSTVHFLSLFRSQLTSLGEHKMFSFSVRQAYLFGWSLLLKHAKRTQDQRFSTEDSGRTDIKWSSLCSSAYNIVVACNVEYNAKCVMRPTIIDEVRPEGSLLKL